MTSQQAQLQALITEIEALLGKATPRLPWKMTGEATEQRRVMEQALSYLKELQSAGALTVGWGVMSGEGAIAPTDASADAPDTPEAASQQVLQALLQEMQYLRAQMVQPLTQEVMALQQQRETLKNEVRQLELERLQGGGAGQPNPAWVNEVVGQLRSSLLEQLTPQLRALQSQIDATPMLEGASQDPLEVSANLPQLSPQQRLEQLRQIQAQTDYMLLKLDANLRAVFDSLDQSIQSYCDTLNQGLDAMHGLGQQGEFIFRTFINHLAQQLQQESTSLVSRDDDLARLRGRVDNLEASSELLAEADESRVSVGDEMASVVNLDDVDLDDLDLEAVDEEITLFQLDEEFADLPSEDEVDWDDLPEESDVSAFSEDEEPTIAQTEPIDWEVAAGIAGTPDTEAVADETDAAMAAGLYTEEIDSLYASLFGPSGESEVEASEPDTPAADLVPETVDESLLSDTSAEADLGIEDVSETAIAEQAAVPAETALDDLLAADNLSAEPDSSEGEPEAAETASLTSLFGAELADELTPAEPVSLESDTIASLTELLPSTEPNTFQQFVDPFAAFDESGDSFIPAPPDEDLLAADEATADTTLDLTLDEETFGQLSEDLSQLEGLSKAAWADAPQVEVTDIDEAADWLEGDRLEVADSSESSLFPEDREELPPPEPTTVDLENPTETDLVTGDESAEETISAWVAWADEPEQLDDAPQTAIAPADPEPDSTLEGEFADEDLLSETDLALDELAATPSPAAEETGAEEALDLGVESLFSDEAAAMPTAADGLAATPTPPDTEAELEPADLLSEAELLAEAEMPSSPDDDGSVEALFTDAGWSVEPDAAQLNESEAAMLPTDTEAEPDFSVEGLFADTEESPEPELSQEAAAVSQPWETLSIQNRFDELPPVDPEAFAEELEDFFAVTDDEGDIALDERADEPETSERDRPDDVAAEPAAETLAGIADLFSDEAAEVTAPDRDADDRDRDLAEPGQATESLDEWLVEQNIMADESATSGDRVPDAESSTDNLENLSLDNVFEAGAEPSEPSPEAPASLPPETLFAGELAEDVWAPESDVEAEDSGFTLEDAFGSDMADADETGLAIQDSMAAATDEPMTADNFDFPGEASSSEALTAESFAMPGEPLADADASGADETISFESSTDESSTDEDWSLTLEGISLDLEIPDFPDEELSLRSNADEVDRAIAGNEPPLTLDAGLFPDENVPLPTETVDPAIAETLEDWSSELGENWAEVSTSELAEAGQNEPHEGAVTPDALVDALENLDLPEDMPPGESETALTLEDWSESLDDEDIEAADTEELSLDNLDLNFELSLDVDEAPASEPSAVPTLENGEELFGEVADSSSIAFGEDETSLESFESDRAADPASQIGDSALSLSGSVSEGFAVMANLESVDDRLQNLMAVMPENPDAALRASEASADAGIQDLPPSQLQVIGSPETSFQVTATEAAMPEALAQLPANGEPLSPEAETRTTEAIIGLPEPREWPESAESSRSPQDWWMPEWGLRGSPEIGFYLETDAAAAQSAVTDAIAELPNSAEAVDLTSTAPTLGDDESLQRQMGQGRAFAVDQGGLISAAVLPFAAVAAALPDIPAYDPNEPLVFPTRSPEAEGADDVGESALDLQASQELGVEVIALDESAWADKIHQLEALADLPDPTAEPGDRAEMPLGLLGLAGDRAPRATAETVSPADFVPTTLGLSGSYETGFEIADIPEQPINTDLDEHLPDLPNFAEAGSTPGGFWTTSLEDQMAADFAAAEMEPAPAEPLGPLSDDELADLFPPRATDEEVAATAAAMEGLDALFDDEAASLDSQETAVAPEESSAAVPVDEVEIDDAIATLTDGAVVPEAEPAELPEEETDFADLFAGEEATSAPDEPLMLEEPDRPTPDLAESEAEPELSDSLTPDVTLPTEDDVANELSLEESLFAEAVADAEPTLPQESASWDPMEAEFSSADFDFSPTEISEPEALETTAEPSLDNIDFGMEEIPEAEIENDEVFRSAFEADFSADEDTDFDEVDLSFDINDLGDLSHPDAAEGDSLTDLELELESSIAEETTAREAVPEVVPETPLEPAEAEPVADESATENLEADQGPEADAALFATSGMLAAIPSEAPGDEAPDFGEEADQPEEEWFLGIDLGTTGLSAVLMEHGSGSVHPLCWLPQTGQRGQQTFRMPAIASLQTETAAPDSPLELDTVGLAALPRSPEYAPAYLLNNLRPLLRVGVPHQTTLGTWEPTIQWTDDQTVSLQQALNGVRALLSLIQDPEAADLDLEAVGLESDLLHEALANLQGVVVGVPNNWSDTYCLNVREAILAAGVIDSPGQIFFLEEAIAAVLSGLPDPSDPPPEGNRQMQALYQCNWQGGTVVMSGGASCTEVGIVDLPYPLDTLTRDDFKLRNLAYGGDALDLDIICQLLVPAERRQTLAPGDRRAPRDGWSWQATLPEVVNAHWDSLQLESMDLPQLAEPDTSARIRLRQHLESSKLGQSLLEAARHLKLILQNQNQYQLELADQSWRVLRRDLESRVLVPYIQRLNQQVNALLSQAGLSSQGINQVICTGGNASFNTIAKWLRQKFPNATIIQDTYPSNRPQTCSRVAYGLVNLCRYPQVLDVPRHQYSDYFLLHEIIRVVPETPMPLNGILHMLEEQGINTDVCQSRIEAILEGHLPPGLIPDSSTRDYLSRATLASETYQGLTSGSLFTKQTRQIYMLNTRQRDLIENHLAAIMLNKHQALTEPMIAQLVNF